MIYIDDSRNRLWNMNMSHMIADTRSELDEMAYLLGLKDKWKQKAGERNEHYDVSQSFAREAIKLGAKRVTQRELVKILQARNLEVYLES